MATETMAEFLARGGSVKKSTSNDSLAQLLQKEGILNKSDAEKVTKDLNDTLTNSLNEEIEQKED